LECSDSRIAFVRQVPLEAVRVLHAAGVVHRREGTGATARCRPVRPALEPRCNARASSASILECAPPASRRQELRGDPAPNRPFGNTKLISDLLCAEKPGPRRRCVDHGRHFRHATDDMCRTWPDRTASRGSSGEPRDLIANEGWCTETARRSLVPAAPPRANERLGLRDAERDCLCRRRGERPRAGCQQGGDGALATKAAVVSVVTDPPTRRRETAYFGEESAATIL